MSASLTTELFFDGESLHGPTRLIFRGSTVESVEPYEGACSNRLVAPGLVDLQMNGHDTIDCSRANVDGLAELDAELAALGTTSWLATIVTAPLDRLDAAIERISDAMSSGRIPGCLGIHLEGPFLGSAPGAHRPDWIIEPDEEWISRLPPTVRLMTVGAESAGAPALVRMLVDRGVTVSLGHTRPTASQFAACVEAGASMVTHLFNGMSGIHHREGGLAQEALLEDRVSVGLIGDMIHVSPATVRLVFRAKHGRGPVLVSDSVAWNSEWAVSRGVTLTDGAPRLADGTLAGSATALADCVALTARASGVEIVNALRAATSAPADAIGEEQKGRIRVGESCDILTFDADLRLVRDGCRLVFPRGNESHT